MGEAGGAGSGKAYGDSGGWSGSTKCWSGGDDVVEHACLGPSRDSGLPVRGSPGAPGCHAFLCALPSSGA